MKIAVVGGGFTGLACALSLSEKGVDVVLFEEAEKLGGLAGGVKQKNWRWSLEYFYHHVFTNDREIIKLAKKVGAIFLIKKPVTTSFLNKKEIPFDSPISVLKFSGLSFLGRIRMGMGLAVLKVIRNGLFLEKYRVVDTLPRLIGREGYTVVWEKLLKAKFGPYENTVNMAWFWARVAKRTKNLGYFEEGFQKLADLTAKKIESLGGKIVSGKKIEKIEKAEDKWQINNEVFDGVVITTPAPIIETILGEGKVKFPHNEFLWGQTLVLELSERMINGYWMNILEKDWPFLVAVEHTNFIDKKFYGNNRVVYLGNYLPKGNKQLTMNADELVTKYLPYLRKINKGFKKKWIKSAQVFRKPFAQPVFPINYSALLPKIKTDQKGLYLANMSMVYPFDRGTNYAVKMGNDVAKQILFDLK